MEYNELYNRFKNITNEITLDGVNNPVILKKYEDLKKAFYSKNPIARLTITSKIEELERILGINNNYIKTLKK